METKNDKLQQQRDVALSAFDKLIQDKKQLETELYQKVKPSKSKQTNSFQFLLILNEKKRKIRELKEEGNFRSAIQFLIHFQ